MFTSYSNHPRTIDIHIHCDEDDSAKLKRLAEVCRAQHVQGILLGGENMGGGDYVPNERVAEIAREYPDAFLFGARINLMQKADPSVVEKYVRMGAVMLKFIYPWFEYDNDEYMPIYEEAEKYRIPCLFHTGNIGQRPKDIVERRPMLRNMLPITLDRIARSFQDLPVIMAHLGTTYYRHEAAEFVKHYSNMYFDLAGSGSWGTISPEDMAKLMNFTIPVVDHRMTGFHKMLIGSDAYVSEPDIVEAAQFYHRHMFEKVGLPIEIEEEIRHGTIDKMIAAIKRP